jgi:hypothetical protein
MYERIAILLTDILFLYAAVGFIFAFAFVTVGVKRLDPNANGSSLAFRLLIFPGSAAFWPLLLRRWLRGDKDVPDERNPHQ